MTGGQLVFSIEHPIYMAPAHPGWSKDADGRATWPVNGYLDEGPRTTDWLAKGVVKQHRTMGTLITMLIRLGFTLEHVEEWGHRWNRWRRIRNGPRSASGRCSFWSLRVSSG